MRKLSQVIAAHTSTSQPRQDQQRLLDQIVNLISSPSPNFSRIQDLLDQLDSDKVDGLHSIIQFSPLEALLSRYPKLVEEDVRILEKLFEKGADLGKVQRGILERMMESESDEEDETLNAFESRLIEEFAKMDKVKEEEQEEEGELNPSENSERRGGKAHSSFFAKESPLSLNPPRQSTPGNTQQPVQIERRSSSLTPLPPSRNVSLIALSDLSQTSSHSQPRRPDPVSPDISRSFRRPSHDSPPFLPPPRSPLRLAPRPNPSEIIQLFILIPERTTMSSLRYYFHQILRVQIFNPRLRSDRPPFHVLLEVEKRLFESGELDTRMRQELISGTPFISVDGKKWNFKVSVAWDRPQRPMSQPRAEQSNHLQLASNVDKSQGSGEPQRPLDQRGWVKFTLSGFSIDTKPSEIESFLARILTYWKDFEVRSNEDGQESIVEFKVRGQNAVWQVEGEFRALGAKANLETMDETGGGGEDLPVEIAGVVQDLVLLQDLTTEVIDLETLEAKVEDTMIQIQKEKDTRRGGGGGEIVQNLALVLAHLALAVVPVIVRAITLTLDPLHLRGGDTSIADDTDQSLDLDLVLVLVLVPALAL
ncbi:hypothetical protein JCM3765_002490 [Sporobolomyces pararoseus]